MNINESVTIKLNETGMEILRAEHADLKSAFPSLHDFVEIEADEDGLYPKKMQLWSVMRTFGPYISLGTNPPFSTEIEISDFDDVNKLKEMNKELLAALEAVIEWYDMEADHSIEPDFYKRMAACQVSEDMAREAIAKAKAAS